MWPLLVAVLLVLLLVGMRAPPSRRGRPKDITESLVLTADDERWILAGRASWSDDLERIWTSLSREAERYETKGGATRLRLTGLGPSSAVIAGLARIVFLAAEANRDELQAQLEAKHGANADLSAHTSFARKEERLDARLDRLEEKIYDLQSRYDAKHHWWHEIDDEERRELRRVGQTWKDFKN